MNFLLRAIQFGFMHIWPALVLIISAAFLPIAQLGTVAILISIATLFRPLVGLSLGRTAIRATGEALSSGGSTHAQKIISLATRLGFLSSIAALFVGFYTLKITNNIYDLGLSGSAIIAATIFIYLYGATEFLDGLMRAQGRFRELAISISISRLTGILILFIAIPIIPSIDSLLIALAASEAINIAILTPYIFSAIRAPSKLSILSKESSSLIKYSIPVIINSLSVYLYARAMVMIVGPFDSSQNVGGFEMVVQITNLPMAITIICATAMSPAIARLYAHGKEGIKVASELVSYGASFSVFTNMLVAAYLIIVGPSLIKWLVPELEPITTVLMIIAPLIAIKAYAQILSGEISIAAGAAGVAAKITIVFSIATIAIGYTLSSKYGVVGAAIAMLISHSLAAVTSVRLLQKSTGISIKYRTKESILFTGLSSIPCIVITQLYSDTPSVAATLGTTAFIASFALLLFISVKLKYQLHEPLTDGVRMIKSKHSKLPEEYHKLSDAVPNSNLGGPNFREALLHLVKIKSPKGHSFWFDGKGSPDEISPQDHADIVYTAVLLNEQHRLSTASSIEFSKHVATLPLFGKSSKSISAHNTAYILGAVRLLEKSGKSTPPKELYDGWSLDLLVDSQNLPKWPRLWSHHSWRVSHWIGGIPSILLHLAKSGKVDWATTEKLNEVLESCERNVIDKKTGLIKAYKSNLLQGIFRKLYSLRHDPKIADIGGVVHILWIYHAIGRPYISPQNLDAYVKPHLSRAPFMEKVPYCLDFDIFQLLRTLPSAQSSHSIERSKFFINDCFEFFNSPIDPNYTLHKLPGAIATLHECAYIIKSENVQFLDIPRVDIIKEAYWI